MHKFVKHECPGINEALHKNEKELDIIKNFEGEWVLYSFTDDGVLLHIKHCPFCGVDLDKIKA